MIVRDLGDAWQVVLQTDHADLSAAFARAWATPLPPSLVVATERHDDGWAVWEQSPRVDEAGKPVNFLEVDVRAHLAFYRAGIAAITEEDADAGLLVSMHGAGIYRQRYGLDQALGPRPRGRGAGRGGRVRRRAGGEVRRRARRAGWEDYTLLQLFDRLSLYFCMRDAGGRRPSSRATGSSRSRRGTCACRPTRSATAPAGSRCCGA